MLAVIVLNHNDSRFLINCIEHIVTQQPDELIIVDDNSTDRSIELIKELQRKYPIKLVQTEKQSGPYKAFIQGCLAAKSEYVTVVSADDEHKEEYVKRMKHAIKDYPLVDLYTCNSEVIREGKSYQRGIFPFDAYVSADYTRKIFENGYGRMINIIGCVIRKDLVLRLWEEAGKRMKVNCDALWIFYAMFTKGFIHIGDSLVIYRSYPNSFGASGKIKDIKESNKLLKFNNNENLFVTQLALKGIKYLPKFLRFKFYDWYYKYDWRVEKL